MMLLFNSGIAFIYAKRFLKNSKSKPFILYESAEYPNLYLFRSLFLQNGRDNVGGENYRFNNFVVANFGDMEDCV